MDTQPNTNATQPEGSVGSLSLKDYRDDMGLEINVNIVSLGKAGLVAARDISRGEVLFYDRALCYVDPVLSDDLDGIVAVEKWLSNLPRKEKERLVRLSGKNVLLSSSQQLIGHLLSLALTLDLPILEDRLNEAWPKVITARRKTTTFCRPILSWATLAFPHSCSPNATVLPMPIVGNRVEIYVVATKAIAKETSIIIDHSNGFSNGRHTEVLDHGVRNRYVQEHESFCTPWMKHWPCMIVSEKRRIAESIVRRTVMQKIGMRISETAGSARNGGDLRRGWMFREALVFADLLRLDGIVDLKISFAYFAAALYAGREGDTLRARELVCHGVHQAAELLAIDHPVLRDYELFGFNKKWDPNVEAVWKGVLGTLTKAQHGGSLDLDWMLDKSGNVNSIRENVTFPTFKLLNRCDQDFNKGIIEFLQRPSRHWFLLAEVDKSADYKGNTILCHDKYHNSFEVSTAGFRSGNLRVMRHGTVVMFPSQMSQPIKSGEGTTIGIAPIQPNRYEVLPVFSLARLMELSDRLDSYALTEKNQQPKCFGCSRVGDETLLRCQFCKLFLFCSVECVVANWTKGKRHRDDCELLQDFRIKQLFLRDWSIFTELVEGYGPLGSLQPKMRELELGAQKDLEELREKVNRGNEGR